MRSCRGGGSAKIAQQRCWGGTGAAGVLRCWRGGGGAPVAGRDDGGSGCAIALLGLLRCCRGVRAVAGVGRWARCFRGRRATVSGLKREVTINMLLEGGRVTSGGRHGVHHGRHRKRRPSRQQKRHGGYFARIEVVVQRRGGGSGEDSGDGSCAGGYESRRGRRFESGQWRSKRHDNCGGNVVAWVASR